MSEAKPMKPARRLEVYLRNRKQYTPAQRRRTDKKNNHYFKVLLNS